MLYYFIVGMILWWKCCIQGNSNHQITRPAKPIKRQVSKAYVRLYPRARTLAVTQMETLLLQRGRQGRPLLSTAAREGDKASFEAVLEALRTRLTPDKVRSFHVLWKQPISRSRPLHVMIIHYPTVTPGSVHNSISYAVFTKMILKPGPE